MLASLLAALAAGSAGRAGATSFTVDSTLDGVDAVPGDGACATLSGDCTLRAAIQETNALPGADSVALPAGTYLLLFPSGPDDAATGDLDITDDLTLAGAGPARTIVDAAGLDRAFQIGPSLEGPDVHLSGLEIRNGFAAAGGGLSVAPGAKLTLEDSAVRDNQSESDGGAIDTLGTTMVIDSSFEDNVAGGLGGAIAAPPGSALHIRGSRFTRNVASGGGALAAGVDIAGASGGSDFTLADSEVLANTSRTNGGAILSGGGTIEDSEIAENAAAIDGGAIENLGTLTLIRTRVDRNATGPDGNGGGIISRTAAVLTLTDSTLVGNQSGATGGGITNGGALTLFRSLVSQNGTGITGGGISTVRSTTLIESTVSENTAGNLGGGMSSSGDVLLIDSTLSGNSTDSSGGGIAISGPLMALNSTISGNRAANNGGGVSMISTPLSTLDNVTLSDNLADSDGDGLGNGGGVSVTAGSVSLANTIVAGNSDAGGEAPDCSGALTSRGYNLLGNPSGCLYAPGPGDITGQAPDLGPLADNGGPTRTHALLAGSPAIDAGNPQPPASDEDACLPADQRGVFRPQDGDGDGAARCDIGAFEVGVFTSTPGKVTGGGRIAGADGVGSANFGFVVKAVAAPSGNREAVSGALTYHDEAAGLKIKGRRFHQLTISGSHAEFSGTADVDGVERSIRVTVDDRGEPGRNDAFGIEVLEPGGYSNGARTLSGGNIQIH